MNGMNRKLLNVYFLLPQPIISTFFRFYSLKLYVTEKFSAQKYEELREIYLLHLNEILPQRTKITFIYLSRVTFDNVCQFVTKNMLGHEIK